MRRRRKHQTDAGDGAATAWEAWGWRVTLWGAFIVFVALLSFLGYRVLFNSTGPYRVEYEGKIVDKSVTLNETQTGTGMTRRLHIEGKSGERFDVIVNANLYDRAQVGMWIRSDRDGAQLSWTEPPTAGGGPRTGGAGPPSVSAPR